MAKLLDENALLAVRDYVANEINEALTTVYKIKGSCTCADLQSKSGVHEGDVWNITDGGSSFTYYYKYDSDTKTYDIKNVATSGYTQGTLGVTLAGDNVVWTSNGWDNLGGLVDLSPYMPLSGTASLSGNIVPMSANSVFLGAANKPYTNVFGNVITGAEGRFDTINLYGGILSGVSSPVLSITYALDSSTGVSYASISTEVKYFDITDYGNDKFISISASYVNLDGKYINLYASDSCTVAASNFYANNGGLTTPMSTFSVYAQNITLNADKSSGQLNLIGGSANLTQSLYSWFGICGTVGLGVNYQTGANIYSQVVQLGIATNGATNLLYVISNPCSYSSNTLPLASTVSQYHIALMENVWTYSQALNILSTGSIPL